MNQCRRHRAKSRKNQLRLPQDVQDLRKVLLSMASQGQTFRDYHLGLKELRGSFGLWDVDLAEVFKKSGDGFCRVVFGLLNREALRRSGLR